MPLSHAQVNAENQVTAPLPRDRHPGVSFNQIVSKEVFYPESDGKPMGETGFHVSAIFRIFSALRHFFRHEPNIYIAADMFLYYEEGNPRKNKSPDVMVIKGVDPHERRIFKTWKEQAVPCVIIEVTSKTTIAEDLFNKGTLYAALGVREYFLFDPLREYLQPALLGFALADNVYVPMEADADGSLRSAELGLILRAEDDVLRLVDPQTGQVIPDLDEAVVQAQQAEQRAEHEAQRAEHEAQRAEHEAQRAEQERQRAEAAEAELARLRALLERK